MQASLGFVAETITLIDPDDGHKSQVLSIRAVRPGGPMDHAGLSAGDIIVKKSFTHGFYTPAGVFYWWLHEYRGSSVTIYVVQPTDSPRTYFKARHELTVAIPK